MSKDKIIFNPKEKTPKSSEYHAMMSENLFRQVFGKRYYGMASAFYNDKYFRTNIIKLINHFKADISEIIAPEALVEYLSYQLGYFSKEVTSCKAFTPEVRGFLVISLKIIATLLGYHYSAGGKKNEPFYIPDLWAEMQGWDNLSTYLDTKEYLNTQERSKIIKQLIDNGKTNTEIATIFNLSKYKIAQIIKNTKNEN